MSGSVIFLDVTNIMERLLLRFGVGGAAVLAAAAASSSDSDGGSWVLGFCRSARAAGVFGALCAEYKWLDLRYRDDAALREECHERCADRVLGLCSANGGIFVKMAQHACTLRPAVPDAYVRRLETLQDRAPSRPFEEVEGVLRAELGLGPGAPLCSPSGPFASLERVPVGSASLAQASSESLAQPSRARPSNPAQPACPGTSGPSRLAAGRHHAGRQGAARCE